MLDWIFEGIVKWVAGVASELLDTVSGLFLDALGTDMTAMEEYFPFVTKAFTVMQYCSWAILFLIPKHLGSAQFYDQSLIDPLTPKQPQRQEGELPHEGQ